MEMSMYQDNESDKTHQMKKSMHLDFASNKTKEQKFANMINSTDMNMLKLGSPDLEKLISHNGVVGTTPTPTQFIYPKYVTDEQEAYARGFVEALAELHQTPGMSGASTASSATNSSTSVNGNQASQRATATASSTYSTLMPMSSSQPTFSTPYGNQGTTTSAMVNPGVSRRHPPFVPSGLAAPMNNPVSQLPQHSMQVPSSSAYGTVQVKSEPSNSSYSDHQVPHSPGANSSRMSDSGSDDDNYDHVENINRLDSIPVDLEEQEKIKLERKRARNRIAARKCRTRKLERIGRLEEKVADLKKMNNELAQTAASYSEQVLQLKQQIMEHIKSGCQIMLPDMRPMGGGY